MAIQAIIPAGQTKVTVNGLHQWDYGQILEVHDDDLPALVEIHFACAGMDEAVVRSCSNLAGVASAVIPDHCLEQIAPVVAWVYGIDGTAGQTLRTIVMPVIRRTKPAPAGSVPTYISDKYTELVSAIAEQVYALKEGDVVVSRALKADQATVAVSATEAVHAYRADNASAADYAGRAGNADKATKAATADVALSANAAEVLHPVHLAISSAGNSVRIDRPGVYAVAYFTSSGVYMSDVICVPLLSKITSSNHLIYEPGINGDEGGWLSSMYGEEIGSHSIYAASMLASYPEG